MARAYKCDRCGNYDDSDPHRHLTIRFERYSVRNEETVSETERRDYCEACWNVIEDVAQGEVGRGDRL